MTWERSRTRMTCQINIHVYTVDTFLEALLIKNLGEIK